MHFIWLGTNLFPYTQYIESWINNHPDYTYCFWNDNNIPFLINQKYFDGNTYETSMAKLTEANSYNQIDITSTSNVKGLKGTTGVFGKVRWSNKSTYGLVLSEDTTHKKFGEPTKQKLGEFNTFVKLFKFAVISPKLAKLPRLFFKLDIPLGPYNILFIPVLILVLIPEREL
jgi:hypothetical protein